MTRGVRLLAAVLRGGGPPCEAARVAGVDALVCGAGPVVVFANAATEQGVEHPEVARLLRALAAVGYRAVAPELPGVSRGEVTPRTAEALVDVARAAGRHVALLGASTGAGLSIVAAADRRLAGRVTAVAAIAPFADLRTLLRFATTGWYGDRPYAAAPLVRTAAARSLRACAPGDTAVEALLANVDPRSFDRLFDDLAPETREVVRLLSPLARIGDVVAPVDLASAPHDPFCPAAEARALARAGRDVRLTVTSALDHVSPRPQPGLASVVLLLDRLLRRAAAAESTPLLQPAAAR